MVLALMNIKIAVTRNPSLNITTNNVRRLFLCACIIASKTLEDTVYINKDWAVISGCFNLAQTNRMELELLKIINWQTFPGFVCPLAEAESITTNLPDKLSETLFPYQTIESFIDFFLRLDFALKPDFFRSVNELAPQDLNTEGGPSVAWNGPGKANISIA
jgi:hypothetical protein